MLLSDHTCNIPSSRKQIDWKWQVLICVSFLLLRRSGSKIVEPNIGKVARRTLLPIDSIWFFRKQKREANDRGRRDALEKSHRTDGESTATGSSTPGAGSNSSMSSIGQEVSNNNEHSLSTPHHSVVCPNTSTSTASSHSNSPNSDSLSAIQPVSSPGYPQQPLALTMNNSRNNNINNSDNLYSRKETFPINHLRQNGQANSSTT